jgi:Rrf2 family protein
MSERCKFAFAVHVLAVLGSRPDGLCTSAMLARTVNTNPVVIRRLLLELQQAGLVVTARGIRGGARLERKPEQIRLGELFRTLEGADLFGCHPNTPSRSCPVGCGIESVLREIRSQAMNAAERELNEFTLADVLAKLRVAKSDCRRKGN